MARIPPVFRDLTDREKRGIIAAYHTSAAYMDRNLGQILDALENAGLADDTLVIFNSDHGYLLGEHGRFEKHCCFEQAVRSALIMRLPGVIAPGRSTGSLVELIDVVPTVLQLCGVAVPASVQGRSLGPLLRGETVGHREHVISEYADNAEAMVRSAGNRRSRDGYAPDHPPSGPTTRLYDLAEDPSEMRDVAGFDENRDVVERLLDVLAHHMKARPAIRACCRTRTIPSRSWSGACRPATRDPVVVAGSRTSAADFAVERTSRIRPPGLSCSVHHRWPWLC